MGSKGGSTTTGSFSPPAEFTKAYKEALGMARTATGKPYEQYSGNLVAGLTPSQTQGISNINAAQGMALPAIQRGMQYTEQAAQGITPELYDRFYSPYVKDVANTTFGNLMESQAQQQSNLKSGAIQAGAFGGDRGGIAQAEMARQQQLGNAMAMSNIYNQGYGQAMGLAGQQVANLGSMGQQIAGLGAGAQASVLQGAQAQMAAGAQQQATEQARLQAAYDQWTQRQAYPYQQAQFFANIAQGLGAGAGGTSSTTQPAPNVFSQIMGGVGAIGSIYGASDKRVKENIQEVGTLNDGQTIYRYNFKGNPKTEIGLLAQEVEHRKPGAVAEVKGLKMVNYKDATDDSASMGGVVAPSEYRQGLAGGGVPFYPYADARTYVPEGKFDVRRNNMPEPPTPFEDKGLAEDWKGISPLSKEQASGLRELAGDVGLDLPEKGDISKIFKKGVAVGPTEAETAWIYRTNPDAQYAVPFGNAAGGVVGRKHYADGGYEPGLMDQAIDEAAGLGAVPDPEVDPRLVRMESGGDFGAKNAQGYVGRMQFGPDRLTDAKRAGIIPADMSSEGFRGDEEAQKATEAWHFGDINNFIEKSGLAAVEGKSIKGIPVTRQGLVNVAHLGGKTGLKEFVASGGQYDPADANGTRLSDYLAMASNQGGVGGATPVPASAEGLSAIAEPAAVEGLGGAEEPKSGLNFDMKKLFASDENPSLIEKVMGRRLSPEARNAVLNASFALMAGRSPFFATNLGEAGKVGTQTYYNALKQGADVSRQAYEAQTGRLSAQGQLAQLEQQRLAFLMPILQQYTTAGVPIPPSLLNLIDREYPKGTQARSNLESDLGAPLRGSAEVAAPSTNAPTIGDVDKGLPKPSDVPVEGGAEEKPEQIGILSPDLRDIYKDVSKTVNPIYYEDLAGRADQKADIARNASPPNLAEEARQREAAERYREAARKIIEEDRKNKFINVPGRGRVPFPGVEEQDIRTITVEEGTKADVAAVTKENEKFSEIQSGFANRSLTLDGIRDALSRAETGSLSELKSGIVNFMNTFGLANADMVSEATDLQVIMKYFAESLSGNPTAKQNLGPNISNADIELLKRGQGDISLLAGANRRIVGALYGKLMYDRAKADAWIEFTKDKPGLTQRDILEFNRDFGKTEKLSSYVEKATADTPVAGEISGTPKSDFYKVGWKYIDPRNGRVFTVVGKKDNGLPISEYVQ